MEPARATVPTEPRAPPRWRRLLDAALQPIDAEKRRLLEARWNELPEELRVPWQVVGQSFTHCGYLMGPSYCSFGCSHCYLPPNANRAPLPSHEEMKAQIEANRALLGHGGNFQITGGDVVDAYWRAGRAGELVEVIRQAVDVGLVPMLMTHGQKLLEHPDYLDRLVVEGRLRKLAVHIDITQAGRPGFPIREVRSERDLHPLREQFVKLIRSSQRRTGVRFFAAHTLTVTSRNLGEVGELIRWLLADRERLRAFRMLSLQPEADVGRTRGVAAPASAQGNAGDNARATPEACWAEVEKALGQELGHDNLWFGDPSCSRMATVLLLGTRPPLDALPSDPRSRAIREEVRQVFAGVGATGHDRLEALLRRSSLLARRPTLALRLLAYARHRLREEGIPMLEALRALGTGRVAALNVVQHNFMDAAEVRAGGPEVERRLRACSFRGAVPGPEGWQAVPMCQLNAGKREELYRLVIEEER
ncbi:MAG: hypothetical protein MI919_01580 [Holophagales bacterium]|nr:hypothetical protein [Holophagales bacterium]